MACNRHRTLIWASCVVSHLGSVLMAARLFRSSITSRERSRVSSYHSSVKSVQVSNPILTGVYTHTHTAFNTHSRPPLAILNKIEKCILSVCSICEAKKQNRNENGNSRNQGPKSLRRSLTATSSERDTYYGKESKMRSD